jgi:hypothetical protein
MAVGLAGAFCGVLVGLTQDNPKTVLAYSSISQMGLMLVALGTGLAWPQAWGAAAGALLLFSLHHALNKAALFLGVGLRRGRTARCSAGSSRRAFCCPRSPSQGSLHQRRDREGRSCLPGWGLRLVLAGMGRLGRFPVFAGTALLMARFCFVVRFAVKNAERGETAGIRWVWASLLALTASGAMLASGREYRTRQAPGMGKTSCRPVAGSRRRGAVCHRPAAVRPLRRLPASHTRPEMSLR